MGPTLNIAILIFHAHPPAQTRTRNLPNWLRLKKIRNLRLSICSSAIQLHLFTLTQERNFMIWNERLTLHGSKMFPISSYRSSGTACFLFCRRLRRPFFFPDDSDSLVGELVEEEDESCALLGGWKPFLSSIYAKSTLSSKSRVWPLHSASRTKSQLRF